MFFTLLGESGFSYDADALVLFAAMVPEPDATRKGLINDFIVGCKADLSLDGINSNWDECDIIRIRAAHSEQASKLNFKDPSLYASTFIGSPTFVTDGYINSNGGGVINENWNPTDDGVKYTLNSASIGIYIINEINSGILTGAYSAPLRSFLYPRDGGTMYAGINATADLVVANASSVGYFTIFRQDALEQSMTVNGSVVQNFTNGSSSLHTIDFCECGVNLNGTPTGFNGHNSASHKGSGFVDYAKMYARFNTYLTAVGAI